jgi:hypothetical protein
MHSMKFRRQTHAMTLRRSIRFRFGPFRTHSNVRTDLKSEKAKLTYAKWEPIPLLTHVLHVAS